MTTYKAKMEAVSEYKFPLAVRQKIAAALRSGEYEQHQGSMCDRQNEKSACCLHVAAITADGAEWIDGVGNGMPDDMFGGDQDKYSVVMMDTHVEVSYLHPERGPVKSWLGFEHCNDTGNLSFEQIARLLLGETVVFKRNRDTPANKYLRGKLNGNI